MLFIKFVFAQNWLKNRKKIDTKIFSSQWREEKDIGPLRNLFLNQCYKHIYKPMQEINSKVAKVINDLQILYNHEQNCLGRWNLDFYHTCFLWEATGFQWFGISKLPQPPIKVGANVTAGNCSKRGADTVD